MLIWSIHLNFDTCIKFFFFFKVSKRKFELCENGVTTKKKNIWMKIKYFWIYDTWNSLYSQFKYYGKLIFLTDFSRFDT